MQENLIFCLQSRSIKKFLSHHYLNQIFLINQTDHEKKYPINIHFSSSCSRFDMTLFSSYDKINLGLAKEKASIMLSFFKNIYGSWKTKLEVN